MRAGLLRNSVVIKSPSRATGADGKVTVTWTTTVATVWASIEPLTGKEFMESQQMKNTVTHRIRIRHLAGVVPTYRVEFDSRVFNIEYVLNADERNIEMELMCKEVV